mmetsp:Transcript_29897/g.69547  ORF Transcript_29897/g.69547 Transcript_29897/m.69547 type:complete len:401 (+) Transcript_29897:117-1319(+)
MDGDGWAVHVHVISAGSGETLVNVSLTGRDTVAAVQAKVRDDAGIAVSEQSLCIGSSILEGRQSLRQVWLENCSSSAVVPEDEDEPVAQLELCLVRSRRNRQMLLGSERGYLLLQDVDTGNVAWQSLGHAQPITALAVDWGEMMGVSGGADAMLHVWDLRRGKRLTGFGLTGHHKRVTALELVWSSSMAVSGGEDGQILLWDMDRGSVTRHLKRHLSEVCCLSLHKETRQLLSGGLDVVKLQRISDGTVLWEFNDARQGRVSCLQVDWSAGRSLLGRQRGTLQVLDHSDRLLKASIDTGDGLQCMAVHWVSDKAITMSQEGVIRIWDLLTHEERTRVVGPGAARFMAVDWTLIDVVVGTTDGLWILPTLELGGESRRLDSHESQTGQPSSKYACIAANFE